MNVNYKHNEIEKDLSYLMLIDNIHTDVVDKDNIEYLRSILDATLKLKFPHLRGHVIRFDNIKLSYVKEQPYKLMLTCNYRKSIKKFQR